MSAQEGQLPDFFAGMPLDHNDPQSIVNALRALQRFVANTNVQGGPQIQDFQGMAVVSETFLAHVQAGTFRSSGFGDATFTDARYYFKRILIDTSINTNAVLRSTEETHTGWILTGVATNLAELPPNNTSSGSHAIQDGTIVQIVSMYTRANPSKKFYLFSHVPFDGLCLRADLTQDNGAGHAGSQTALCTYTYTAKFLGTTNTIGTAMSPEASFARSFPVTATAATKGLVYWHNGAATLAIAFETTSNKACA